MAIETPRDLFLHNLKTMYYVEKTLVPELEEMSKEATNDKLKSGFSEHAEETSQQADRLEQVFEILGESPEEEESAVLKGLIQEANELNENITEADLLNIAYTSAGMKVERMEITAYEGLIRLAKELRTEDDVEDLLQQNLDEEEDTLRELQTLAKGSKMKSLIGKLLG